MYRRENATLLKQHSELMKAHEELKQALARQQTASSDEQTRLRQRCEENDQRISRLQQQRDEGAELRFLRDYAGMHRLPVAEATTADQKHLSVGLPTSRLYQHVMTPSSSKLGSGG